MTLSTGLLNRMRWASALTAVPLLLALMVAFSASRGDASLGLPSAPGITPTGIAAAGSSAPLDPRIAALARTEPSRSVQAIVQFKPAVSEARATIDSTRAGGRVFGRLHIIHALAVKLTAGEARALSTSADVHAVSLNSPIRSSTDGVGDANGNPHSTYAQTLKARALRNRGIDGAGIGVAVIDTGIDGGLADFSSSSGTSRVVETAVTNPAAQTASDSFGHGTDVAGIIAGNGSARDSSDPLYGRYAGVAPGANLISIKASDETGTATVLNVIYGLQFAVDHKSDYNIRVVNLSLNSTTAQSYTTDPLDAAAESAWMNGIVVVAAAGNRGNAPDAVQYAPANDPYVITVGGVDENGTADPSDDTVADWSSQGTTQDGFQKPDVYAPGAHIVSVLAPNSAFADMCPSCIVSGEYIRTSGSSMAAPMISGLTADLLQAHPHWSPDQVKTALTNPSVSANSGLQEIDARKLVRLRHPAPANQDLTPSNLITDSAGNIDYSLSSWSRSSWSSAPGSLNAGFAMSSWSCDCAGADTSSANPSLSSWSLSSWSTLEPLVDDPGKVRGRPTPAARAIARAAAFAHRAAAFAHRAATFAHRHAHH
jgi:serine protease AprX